MIGEVSRGWVARCLACGLAGGEREDGLEAKLAFDEAINALTYLTGALLRKYAVSRSTKKDAPQPRSV
jgi:hypothetical protein